MGKLLIIDDHAALLEILVTAFEDFYEVKTVASGEEALEVIPVFRPDAILTDYKMAGMDGLELLAELKKISEPPKVIVFSAWMNSDLAAQAKALGAVACLEKPFELEDLRGKVRQAMGK